MGRSGKIIEICRSLQALSPTHVVSFAPANEIVAGIDQWTFRRKFSPRHRQSGGPYRRGDPWCGERPNPTRETFGLCYRVGDVHPDRHRKFAKKDVGQGGRVLRALFSHWVKPENTAPMFAVRFR
jgi:hypothetical protein